RLYGWRPRGERERRIGGISRQAKLGKGECHQPCLVRMQRQAVFLKRTAQVLRDYLRWRSRTEAHDGQYRSTGLTSCPWRMRFTPGDVYIMKHAAGRLELPDEQTLRRYGRLYLTNLYVDCEPDTYFPRQDSRRSPKPSKAAVSG